MHVIFSIDNGGTRGSGLYIRNQIMDHLAIGNSVELDLKNTNLTPGFVDECLGKLAKEIGSGRFKSNIKIVNASETVLTLINHVVTRRLTEKEIL